MKIVINALHARRGGGITYILNLFEGMGNPEGCEFVILTSNSFKYSNLPNCRHLIVNWPTENPLLRSVWERFVLPSMLRRLKADILFCPGGLINLKVPAGCKSVTMFRNMLPFDPVQYRKYGLSFQYLRNLLLKRLMLKSMRQADLVIFVSNFARNVIKQELGSHLKRSPVIPHGLNQRFKTAGSTGAARPDWLPKKEYLLYVSHFEVYKGQQELVEGYHILRQQRQTEEKLVLIGKNDNRYGQETIRMIHSLGLQDEILTPGIIDYWQLPGIYHHAKLNIFASSCENCPNILLEVLGAGRPVLVSDRPPMPEFGKDAVVYFDPSSPTDIAEKVMLIIDDQKAKETMSDAARQLSEYYSWKETVARTLKEIKKLSESNPTVSTQ